MVTKAVPNTPAELEEFLSDPKNVDETFADPEQRKEFLAKYSKLMYQNDPDLISQHKETTKLALKEFYENNEVNPTKRLPLSPSIEKAMENAIHGKSPRGMLRQAAAYGKGQGQALDGHWATLADFIIATSPQTVQRTGIPDIVQKVMTEAGNSEGGFLVPEEFRVELLMIALEMSVVRSRARVIPMATQSVRIPAIRDASHASTVFGGVSGSWVAEGGSLSTVTQPTFQQVKLEPFKLTGYTRATNELLTDAAISLEGLIGLLFPQAIAYFEDDAFLSGTGAGQPLGIINADALISVAKETNQAATTVVYENLTKMFARMLPSSINSAVWVVNPDVFPQLASLSLSVGTGGSAVWLANVGAAGAPPATILGRPVVFSEKMQTLGTAFDIAFIDFNYYLIGDRMALQMAASEHVNFNTDEMTWRFTQRVDGRPWLTTALNPRNGTNTLSPLVSLAVRS